MTVGWRDHAEYLTAHLVRSGELRTEAWIEAFASVPRHMFVPGFYDLSAGEHVDGADPAVRERWLRSVYSDEPLVTQVRRTAGGSAIATSSSTMPTIMAWMLEALDVHDGMRVLEIGTGTGYNAALLSHRLGDANVCSVDLDPGLVADARAALDRVGLHPFLAVGNGYHGLSSGAPYDRIVCTAASDDISPEWIDQLKTGGLIVTDLRGDIGGAVAIVTKTSDGVAEGRFATFEAAFMPLRAEVDHPLRAGNTPPDPVDRRNPWRTTTTLAPDCVVDDRAFRFFLQLHLAGTSMSPFTREGGAIVGIGRDSTWVEVDTTPRPDGEHQVAEGGPRRTWHTVEAAHALWRRLGRPPVDRFGISANGGYSRVWFDDPDGPYSWPMPL